MFSPCLLLSFLYLSTARSTPLNHNLVDDSQSNRQQPHLTSRVASPAAAAAAACSVDHIVTWINFGQIAELISKWAEREKTRPMWVLEQLGNSIVTSEQVHRLQKEPSDEIKDMPPVSFKHHGVHHSQRPSVDLSFPAVNDLPFGPPRLPPIGLFQPSAHLMESMPPPPPPFLLRPPSIGSDLSADQTSFIPILPMGGLRPPPDAKVRIADGVFSTSLSTVPVTVTPRMTVADAVQQASAKFRDGDAVDYEISSRKNSHRKCFSVHSVGNVENTNEFVWEISVADSAKQEMWRSVCLPQLSEVQVRPAMTITLNYVSQDDTASD